MSRFFVGSDNDSPLQIARVRVSRSPDIDYPFHDEVVVVTHCGRICLGNKKINFSTVFAGQAVGIKEVQDDIWLVSFLDYDLGYFDLDARVLELLDNPFGPRLSPT